MDSQCLLAGVWVPQNSYPNKILRQGHSPDFPLGKLRQGFAGLWNPAAGGVRQCRGGVLATGCPKSGDVAFAVWGFRSRSSTRRADEAGQTAAIARATLSTAGYVAGKARRTGQPGGTARKDLAANDRGLRSRSQQSHQ